ncbi:chaplin family protein [Streptosporangium sp. NBC_01495]
MSVPAGRGGDAGAGGNRTSGQHSVLGGNQVVAPITAPINVCGNAVAVLGGAFAGCQGGASVGGGGGAGAGGNTTSGRGSVLGGNQVVAPITAPINVCGNAVGVLGQAAAACRGGASVSGGAGAGTGAGGNRTSGQHSVLGGNQVVAPITAPINICGNAVAVLGDAAAGCLGGSRVGGPSGRPGGGQWGGPGGHGGYDNGHGDGDSKPGRHKTSGLLPALPAVPALGGAAGEASAPGLASTPAAQGAAADRSRFPAAARLPELPAVPAVPASPASDRASEAGNGSPSAPVAGLTSTPAGALPVGDLGLMSAAQPVGVTGMNIGSLVTLLIGAMAAAAATVFGTTRRIRFGKK